jgi:very-short-patch-repair endonuclease
MRALLQSEKTNDDSGVPLSKFVVADRQLQAAASLRSMTDRARANFEERGLDTLFLALGLATWTPDDEGRPSCAPVLLLPVKATQKGSHSDKWSLCRAGDVKVNEVLLHSLQVEHGITITAESLLSEILGDNEGEAFDLGPLFQRLRRETGRVTGFDVQARCVLGNFSFQKLAIVKDLNELLQELARHDIVAGIAGDQTAAELARGSRIDVDPRDFDQSPPDEEFLVRDADASQQQAIAATISGQSGVISGPPGTGKSQTISNLIAEMAARGKTVLFVAEKRAALDVVLNRLRELDLDHLCLDLHGADISRRLVAKQLQESLTRVREATEPATAALHARFIDRREALNGHVRRMHSPRLPSGLTVYEMYGRLLQIPKGANARTRFNGPALACLDERTLLASLDLLRDAAGLSGFITGEYSSAWSGAVFTNAETVRLALDRARWLADHRWPACEAALNRLLAQCPLTRPRTIGALRHLIGTLSAVEEFLGIHQPHLFACDLGRLFAALAPARSPLRFVWALIFDPNFRAAVQEVRGQRRDGHVSARGALEIVERAQTLCVQWSGIATAGAAIPQAAVGLLEFRESFQAVIQDLEPLIAAFPNRRVDELACADLGAMLQALARDAVTPTQLLRVHDIEVALARLGVGAILPEIRSRKPEPALWPELLRHAWLSSCLEDVQLQDPTIAAFHGRAHAEIVAEFQQLDRERLTVAVARVTRAHAQRAIKVRNSFSHQNGIVAREAQKKARHIPLRQLVAQAPDVLLALRPCWMASPLSVSQLIPGDKTYFDLVIFDEASQVLPEDAVTSLLRGARAVVAGDRRQLPPTTFFAAGEDEEGADEDNATGGFESILDVMSAFLDPPWSLDWHYRSRDEALIAFSNHRIYGGRLVTFPGPGFTKVIRHEVVPHVPGDGTQEQSSAGEVQRVVDLVIEHARLRPAESLGVIAMGIKHAQRIEMALDRERQNLPELEEFFAADKRERFFVKNLERVQGDERDAIILSIGYGKNEAGHLLYRFGPLLQQGGERRLNVAITRARQRLTLVSSFSHLDMDPGYPNEGVRLLRAYLEYAASGGQRLDCGTVTAEPLNEFEQSVCDELTRRGMKVIGQLGKSRYRIDLVAMHPQHPGRYVLAIECDGATYHSAPTARDRDRLRQQQLEALGWRFHRIWSTDWFLRRSDEIERMMQAYREAVRQADDDDNDSGPAVGTPGWPWSAPDETVSPDPVSGTPIMRTRGKKPWLPSGQSVDQYSNSQLAQMVRWVESDGCLRTDEEIVTEVVQALGFKRRGNRIVAAIKAAIPYARRQP